MNPWPLERKWLIQTEDGSREEMTTRAFCGRRACVFLGSAGLGKTHELRLLEEHERKLGYPTTFIMLAEWAISADYLNSELARIIAETTATPTCIYIDAVDEAMIPVKTTTQILTNWIQSVLPKGHLDTHIRISCRSAVWPGPVQAAITRFFGKESVSVAALRPLDEHDVRTVLATEVIDPSAFFEAVDRARAHVLCQQPITLGMLLRLFKRHAKLPSTRRELYSQSVQLLVMEREERRERETVPEVSPEVILEAAERLACLGVLSGRETVDLTDDPREDTLGWADLSSLPSSGRQLDERLLKAVGCTGLCDGAGHGRFRFMHRQIAEYLSGRRLARLPLHQSRSLLCSSLGYEAGVAGALRETAAFAAMENEDLAKWISDTDPEVIGLSDVADETLRRKATLGLLEKFRRHELTDSHVVRDSLPLAGLHHAWAEDDLRQVLKERGDKVEDVLECAIELIDSWELVGLGEDLADLILDRSVPLHPRVHAGYVLSRLGANEARSRIKILLGGSPDDPDDELKGIALRCNWPDNLTTAEMLPFLKPLSGRLHGSYYHFLITLRLQGFNASDDIIAGLEWAIGTIRRGEEHDPTHEITQNIAHAAIGLIGDVAVADALTGLILVSAQQHVESPLAPIRQYVEFPAKVAETPSPLVGDVAARRTLIASIAARASDDGELWWAVHQTPGLFTTDDFPWLLERATDTTRPMQEREHFARIARYVPIHERHEWVEAWLEAREIEPVRSIIDLPLYIELGTDRAAEAKRLYHQMMRDLTPRHPRTLIPPPTERVIRMLELSESKHPRFFLSLCRELTLTEDSDRYRFERFLIRAPGWLAADESTRVRIVDSAKRLLVMETDEPESARNIPLNNILQGYMPAIWLLLEVEPSFFDELPNEWWNHWSWYILRELHPNLSGEPQEPKQCLLMLLHTRSPSSAVAVILGLLESTESDSRSLLDSLLDLFGVIEDSSLDIQLLDALKRGKVEVDRALSVCRFLLDRCRESTLATCRQQLEARSAWDDCFASEIALALLLDRTEAAWNITIPFLESQSGLAKNLLARYAHAEPSGRRRGPDVSAREFTVGQVARLIQLFLEHYPPETDPKHEGAFWVSDHDSAVMLRDQLISTLGSQSSIEALEALRELEVRFASRYPWLRRPRSAVERAYRQSLFHPIPPTTIANLLTDQSKRIIRSESDAIDGILAALELYERSLHHASPAGIEDLWDTPFGLPATPKKEERISDKICEAIRRYFSQYAVAADREVQLRRRNVATRLEGEPGSEVDVLVTIPAAVTLGSDPILIPIEVKRSCNPEAKTGLCEQLVERYMSEIGASAGVFVVAWLEAPSMETTKIPKWTDMETARSELTEQAAHITKESGGAICVKPFVLDATLR